MSRKATKSYWDGNGNYQSVLTVLYDELVPSVGEAETVHGEIVRAVSRLFYEYGNNGNCNAAEEISETCDECGGWGYEEEEVYCGVDDDGEEVYEKETYDCSYCGGDCNVVTGLEMDDYYADMLNHIRTHVPDISSEVDAVEALITDQSKNYNYDYSQEEMDVYNRLADKCLEFLIKEREINLKEFEIKAAMVNLKDKKSTADFWKEEQIKAEIEYEVFLELGGDKSSKEAKEHRSGIKACKNIVKEYNEKADVYKKEIISLRVKQEKKAVKK
jgi:hypothetical protein